MRPTASAASCKICSRAKTRPTIDAPLPASAVLWIATLTAVVALCLWALRALRGPQPPTSAPTLRGQTPHELASQLTGDPTHDHPLRNRVLALGGQALPELLPLLSAVCAREPGPQEAPAARHQAALETLIADFGLLTLGPVTQALTPLAPTQPYAAALARVLAAQGTAGLSSLYARAEALPALAPYLPKIQTHFEDTQRAEALRALMRQRTRALDEAALHAGLLAFIDSPLAQRALWPSADAEARGHLLRWFWAWPGRLAPDLLCEALRDTAPSVRHAAAVLASLGPPAQALPDLHQIAQGADEVAARPALSALLRHDAQGADLPKLLRACLSRAPLPRALDALTALSLAPMSAAQRAPHLATLLARSDLDPALAQALQPTAQGAQALLAQLERAQGEEKIQRIHWLPLAAPYDPRVRERLLWLAHTERALPRLAAIEALAGLGEGEVADALARAVRESACSEQRVRLQCAAQLLGERCASPLARRLRPQLVQPTARLLAVLRSVPAHSALPSLLKALDETSDGPTQAALIATLNGLGATGEAQLYASLTQPGRGLCPSALHYMAYRMWPEDIPLLLSLYQQNPAQGPAILRVVAQHGARALPALQRLIDAGGDDHFLLPLEALRAQSRLTST